MLTTTDSWLLCHSPDECSERVQVEGSAKKKWRNLRRQHRWGVSLRRADRLCRFDYPVWEQHPKGRLPLPGEHACRGHTFPNVPHSAPALTSKAAQSWPMKCRGQGWSFRTIAFASTLTWFFPRGLAGVPVGKAVLRE